MGCRSHVPVWHQAAAGSVKDGKLVLLGITEEQHADRCRLFAQWKKMDWPILHDPINVMESSGVPILVAIDEHGIIRQVEPTLENFEKDFLDKKFTDDSPQLKQPKSEKPDLDQLRKSAQSKPTAKNWRRLGDALALWGGDNQVNQAIDAYSRALQLQPKEGATYFRLGVCYRRRFESKGRKDGDFQSAIDAWGKALTLDPNQYIWRRRIQQYGPRLDKPYAFYDWVDGAIKDVNARKEQPVALAIPPQGAELAQPAKKFEELGEQAKAPDPDGKIHHDEKGLIAVEVTVVAAQVAPGQSARIHFHLRPDAKRKVHWNNESEPLRLWIDVPDGWKASQRLLTAAQGKEPETKETRALDFEIQVPAAARGRTKVKGYALYYVCEDVRGTCLFLRKDIEFSVDIRKEGKGE